MGKGVWRAVGLAGMFTLGVAILVLGTCGVASAQVPAVKNPSALTFTSADHANAAVTGYEVDILNGATVVQTLVIAKSATTVLPNGDVKVTLNVQPIAFGTYKLQVRTVAGAVKSDNSVASDDWVRSPGAPSKPIVQ